MIKFEHTEVVGWEAAIRCMRAKGYRKTKTGRFEAFCSERGETIYLGTHDTVEEAEEAVFQYRVDRLINRLEEYMLDIDDSVIFERSYLAFSNGMIFNLHGIPMIGHVNRDGYISGIINGRNIQFHRIIASIFCEREIGKDYVNHIDGDKTNNDASNLEWCTRSENALHAYRTGLQTYVGGSRIFTEDEKEYMWANRYGKYREVAKAINRNPSTVRKYLERYRRADRDD